jgi:hypothetical protein
MGRKTRKLLGSGLALTAWLAPQAAAAAGALDLYYERALMSAADARCNLFEPPVSAALEASAAQARGAALRGGVSEAALAQVKGRAGAKAASVPCASPDLTVAAGRVKSAFDGWSRTARMTFPGQAAAWRADRTAYRSAAWRLVQTGEGGASFGVAGAVDRTALTAVASFPEGDRPYAARLVFRDAARAPRAWLGAPEARVLPPRDASRVVLAAATAPADGALAGKDVRALAFRFPDGAGEALAGLDPRERFAVEFLLPGDRVKTAVFEVGDFAAGRAFLKLGSL